MKTVNDIFDKVRLADEVGDWKECIELSKEALALTDQSRLEEWFKARFDLANFLLDNKNKQPENIETAIKLFHELLENVPQQKEPEKYAAISVGLGFAYDKRLKGNKQENLKRVLRFYKQALTVFGKDNYPEEWAMTQAGIGLAYAEKKTGSEKENILTAIAHYKATLEVYTPEKYPEDYEDSMQELTRLKERLEALKENFGPQMG